MESLAPPSATPSSREGDRSGRFRMIYFSHSLRLPLIPGHTATIQRFVSLCPLWTVVINESVCGVISHVGCKSPFPSSHTIDHEVAYTLKYFRHYSGRGAHSLPTHRLRAYQTERGKKIGLPPTMAWPEFSCFINEHVDYFHRFAQEQTRDIIFGLDSATPPLLPLDTEDRQLRIREMLTDKMFLHTVNDDNQVCMFQAPCVGELLRRVFWGPYLLKNREPWYSGIPPMAFVTVITLFLFSLHQIEHLGSDYPFTDFNEDNEIVHKYHKLARTIVEDVRTGEESGPPFEAFCSNLWTKIKAASKLPPLTDPNELACVIYTRGGDY